MLIVDHSLDCNSKDQVHLSHAATNFLFRDYETASHADLKRVGARNYAAHSSTKIICCAYAVNDGPVLIWRHGDPAPEVFHTAAQNPNWRVVAHNDHFETCLEQIGARSGWPQVPMERHLDTMVMAARLGYPQKLELLAKALGLTHLKDMAGHRVMLGLSKRPDGPWDPDKLERLHLYVRQDVATMRDGFFRLRRWETTPTEEDIFNLHRRINERGFHVDRELARAAHAIVKEAGPAIDADIKRLTNGAVGTINQRDKLLAWLRAQGIAIDRLRAKDVDELIERNGLPSAVHEVLELRRSGAQAASRKLDALLDGIGPDGRLRDAFRYHGAATGRWAGAGFQPQNLKHPETDDLGAAIKAVMTGDYTTVKAAYRRPLSVIGDLSRSLISASPGHLLVGGDYTAIESIVTAWLCDESWKLKAYADYFTCKDPKKEPYSVIACRLLGLPPGSVTKADKTKRKFGKTADLAFGYGGSVGAWRKFDPEGQLSDDEVKAKREAWKTLHRQITRFWRQIENSARDAIKQPNQTIQCGRLAFQYFPDAKLLFMTLPSGRRLGYPEAQLVAGLYGDRPDIQSKKLKTKGGWTDCRLWFGLLVENAVQGIARDILAEAMLRLESAGFGVVAHVHDEAVIEVQTDAVDLRRFTEIMCTPPDWASDLPLSVDPWVSERFDKRPPPMTLASTEAKPLLLSDGQETDYRAIIDNAKARVSLVNLIGEKQVLCPYHEDHNPSLYVYEDHFHCYACEAHGDHLDWLQQKATRRRERIDALHITSNAMTFWEAVEYLEQWNGPLLKPQAIDPDAKKTMDLAERLWEQAGSLLSSPIAQNYLAIERGLDVSKLPADIHEVLRFHPRCPWGHREYHPAIIARFRDILTDSPAGIHRIALTPDGKKIGRQMLGRWPTPRAIKLWPAASHLYTGEGIETVLAGATVIERQGRLMQPAWATGSAAGIASLPVVPNVSRLTILVDNDANGVGRQAAQQCADRWQEARREVIFLTPKGFKDFNDLVLTQTQGVRHARL